MSTPRRLALTLAVTAALLGRLSAQADVATGFWTPGPPMSVSHDSQPAIVLKDGRVLVLGNSSEVYDPASNRWDLAGKAAISRLDQTATLLPDGRVFVVGGIDTGTGLSVARAELYDPTTNAWSAAPSMAGRRYFHTATLLTDGRVLVAGGMRATVVLDSVEIYDPKRNAWSPGPPLLAPRADHTATLLADGSLLIAGGSGTSGPLATAELFDPVANRWAPTGSMAAARVAFSSPLLEGGEVLAVGGLVGSPPPAGPAAERFNPASGTWSSANSVSQPELGAGITTTLLKDGRVLVCGGASPIYLAGALRTGFIYDPKQDRWSPSEVMHQGRVEHSAGILPDGRVLVAGGRDAWTNGTSLDSTEIYTAASAQPVTASAKPMPVDPPLPPATRPWLPPLVAVIALGLLLTPLALRRWTRRRRV